MVSGLVKRSGLLHEGALPAIGQVVESQSQAVDVDFLVQVRVRIILFRSREARGQKTGSFIAAGIVGDDPGNSEVSQNILELVLAFAADVDVGWLDVPVNHVFALTFFKGIADIDSDLGDFLFAELLSAVIGQGIELFHDNEQVQAARVILVMVVPVVQVGHGMDAFELVHQIQFAVGVTAQVVFALAVIESARDLRDLEGTLFI